MPDTEAVTEKMPEQAPTRGLVLPCPLCGEQRANLKLYLNDGCTFDCTECDGEFTITDLQSFIALWGPVIRWLETMPTQPQ